MSACTCGHPERAHRIYCPTATERTIAMIDKTPPYVTTFDQIKTGQLIEREWAFKGVRFRAEGIAHHVSPAGYWYTADGGIVAGRTDTPDITDTLRVLAEPSLPMEPGTVIRCTLDAERTGRSTATMIRDGFGGWRGPDLSGDSRDVTESESDRITDWVVVYDPSAPKADDGLRERVEKLVEDLAANGGYHARADNDYQRGKGDGLRVAVESLRHLLGATETSADA